MMSRHDTTATSRRGPRSARSGISLMEVLISIFVIAIGLLGIAALIPVANYALRETSKSDRTAACGQAAMRDVRVRALADPTIWELANVTPLNNAATYVIDPLGETGTSFGQVPVVAYKNTMATAVRERIFYWNDDLLFDMLEGSDNRPRGFDLDGNGTPDGPIPERSYSWFLTVTPSRMVEGAGGQRRQFTVSVVVCYQRDLKTPTGFTSLDNVLLTGTSSGAIVSGIQVSGSPDLQAGQWVMLSGLDERKSQFIAQWYRITAGYDNFFSLEGPSWPSAGTVAQMETEKKIPNQLVVVPGVLGVYTTTFEVNHTPAWLR